MGAGRLRRGFLGPNVSSPTDRSAPGIEANPCCPKERPVGAETGRDDDGVSGEVESEGTPHAAVRRQEEGCAEPERHRTRDHAELEVEERHNRRHGTADHLAASLDIFRPSISRRATSDGPDRRPRGLGLETALHAAGAASASGLHHKVTDVPGIAALPIEESTVQHDPTTHPGRHDHGEEARVPSAGATPSFREREGLGVVVHRHLKAERTFEPICERKGSPDGDVER